MNQQKLWREAIVIRCIHCQEQWDADYDPPQCRCATWDADGWELEVVEVIDDSLN